MDHAGMDAADRPRYHVPLDDLERTARVPREEQVVGVTGGAAVAATPWLLISPSYAEGGGGGGDGD